MDEPDLDAETSPDPVVVFEEHRSRLFGLAYRMLGSASEAEDIVQDAYLRWSGAESVRAPGAWLTKVVTNLCLNHLASARVRRESYAGPWIPEPVLTEDGTLGPLEAVEQRESVSLGVLVLLERLSPVERAVFVLREAFGYSHREVAGILDIAETYSRQLLRRARGHLDDDRQRFRTDQARHTRTVEAFISAARAGDVSGLEKLLAEEVVAWSDGGGATAARRPVRGRQKVLRYLLGIGARPEALRITSEVAQVNGEPALLIRDAGELRAVVAVEVSEDGIVAIRTVINERKLAFVTAQDRDRATP
jgi:RNA polymerase sigma-70 factor (ECF subfamily)